MHIVKQWGLVLMMLIAICCGFSAAEESWISLSPSSARVGEIVDVSIKSDAEAVSVTYCLKRDDEIVFQGKEDTHFQSSFRPREEGEYVLEVLIQYQNGDVRTASAQIIVSGRLPSIDGKNNIFSQKDGWWKDKAYSRSDLENAGCAIFTLSHALQRIGRTGEELQPEQMAMTYKSCYSKYGTVNSRLIALGAQDYGYTTQRELIKSKADIRDSLHYGDQFSFGIVNGHIALMTDIDLEHDKVLIIDSAPSATFERIKRGSIYYLDQGEYREASEPGDIPGSRYYFETQFYGGLAYYMDLEYCARRGGRLIRPSWFSLTDETGYEKVQLLCLGTGQCSILVDGNPQSVPTRKLKWGNDLTPKLAISSGNKGMSMVNAERKRIATIPAHMLVPVFWQENGRACVIYQDKRGYIKLENAEILEPIQGEISTGLVAVEGKTEGKARVKVRIGPSEKHRIFESWRVGTEVTLVGSEGDFLEVEADGKRAWIRQDFIVTGEQHGKTVNEGE